MEPTGAERHGREGPDGRVSGSERVKRSTKSQTNCRAFVSNAFVDFDPGKQRNRLADDMPVRHSPPLCICK
jgi:hypothetical protein